MARVDTKLPCTLLDAFRRLVVTSGSCSWAWRLAEKRSATALAWPARNQLAMVVCTQVQRSVAWRVPLPSGHGAFPHLRSNQDLVFVCIDAKEFRDGEKLKAKDF